MNIVIFGANGVTGRLLVRQALDAGHDVSAFTRRPDGFPIEHPSLQVIGGDALDAGDVERAVKGSDAVLSSLGVPFSKEPITTFSAGTANVLAAMRRAGVERFACVSSSAVEPDPFRQGGAVYRRFMQPYVVDKLGKTLYDDLKRMEASVRESELDWTIVRPSGLFEHEPVTDYSVAEDHVLGRFTSRTDLADCLLRQASEGAFSRKVLAIATVAVQPSMVKLIWNEGIKKKSP